MINSCFCWSGWTTDIEIRDCQLYNIRVMFDANVSDSAPLGRMCPSIMRPKSVQFRGPILPILAFLPGSSSEARARARAYTSHCPG